ncbi:formylmethanofuran dehydrogenase [candidate division KSB1 bacterium]|nr:formylmethanofuran dehydrogenase [candidate division KSB1 bacterium]
MKKQHEMTYDEIVAFHGHDCPGLLLGYRMTRAAMSLIAGDRSEDEEIVAIVENDACGVDALQCLTGCTFGKGNLIFRDYGKHVYTIFNRTNRKAVRVSTSKNQDEKRKSLGLDPNDRQAFANWLRSAPDDEIMEIKGIPLPEPDFARIHNSVTCGFCGELVMETRARVRNGKISCIPCSEASMTA